MDADAPAFAWPIAGPITQPFGNNGHPGIDIGGANGGPVGAPAAGTVTYAQFNNGGYGNLVEIDHGNGWTTKVAHLSRIDVRVGQQVARGQMVGAEGSTGHSTGPHVHYEIRRGGQLQNPAQWTAGKPGDAPPATGTADPAAANAVSADPGGIAGTVPGLAGFLSFSSKLSDPGIWRRVLSVLVGGYFLYVGILIITRRLWVPAATEAAKLAAVA